MRNLSICETKIQRFAFKILLWATEEGVFEKLLKTKELVSDRKDTVNNFAARYKIRSIGPSAIICAFENQASENDLKDNQKIRRYFSEDVELKEYFSDNNHNYFYLSNQWENKVDATSLSLPKFIEEINKIIMPEYACGYTQVEIEGKIQFLFYVTPLVIITSKITDRIFEQIAVQELEEITINTFIQNGDRKIIRKLESNHLPKKYENLQFSNIELRNNFMWRLKTQDRRRYSSSELSFYVRLFDSLDIDFTTWCNKQIDNIQYYTEDGIILTTSQIETFIVDKGRVFVISDGLKMELIFEYDNNWHFFDNYVTMMRFVSLDHVQSMDKILHDLKSQLPALKEVSDKIYKHFENTPKLNKEMCNKIKTSLSMETIDALKKELDVISENIQLVLLPRSLNSAKGNRY